MVDETQSENMRMGQSKRRPQHDYYLAGNNLQDSVCEKDLDINIVPNLSPESPIRTAEKNCLLANVRIAFKYMDKEVCSRLLISYTRPKLEYASQVLVTT